MNYLDEQRLVCPYCGEIISVLVDTSVEVQTYIEDCQVCCRPMVLTIEIDDDGTVEVAARTENE